MHKIRGSLFKIQYSVQLDAPFFVLVGCPWKGIEREGNSGGIQQLDTPVYLRDVVALPEMLSQRFPDGIIRIPENLPAAMLILVGYGGFRGSLLTTQVVDASLQTAHEPSYITDSPATGNVAERHPDKVVPGVELFGVSVGVMLSDNGRKCGMAYQIVDKLGAQW